MPNGVNAFAAQSKIRRGVVVTNQGRAPVVTQPGRGLNSGNVPKANVAHVTNPNQRKVG